MKSKSLLCRALALALSMAISFCLFQCAFAAEISAEDSSLDGVSSVEEVQTEPETDFIVEEPAETIESAEQKHLKPAQFRTEAKIMLKAQDESQTKEEQENPDVTAESAVLADSVNPILTLVKEQAVNDGERTAETVKAHPGDVVTLFLTVTNTEKADSPAKSVTISDTIPAGMVYIENSATAGAEVDGNIIRWGITDLEAGESIQLSYQVQIPEDARASTYSGTANASCYIESMEDSPKTADENRPALWLTIAGASAVLLLAGGAELICLRHE